MKAILTTDGTLKEMPEMPKPICINGVSPSLCDSIRRNSNMKRCECLLYSESIKKCRELTIVGSHNWVVGQVLEQGKDYKLELQADPYWQPSYHNPDDPPMITVAVPISDSQEELWQNLIEMFRAAYKVDTSDRLTIDWSHLKKILSDNFTITRK